MVPLVLLLLAAGVLYAGACTVWPYTSCRWCKGTGKRTSPTGKAYGRCRHCKGKPEQLRIGRRVLNALTTR